MARNLSPTISFAPGDFIILGENPDALYEVVAVCAQKAWVHNIARGSDLLVSAHRCRRIGPAVADTLH